MFVDIINIGLFINNEIKESRIVTLDDSYLDLRDSLLGVHLMSSCNFDQEIGFVKMIPFSDGDLLKIISDDTTEEEKALLQKAIPCDDVLDELMAFAEEYESKQFAELTKYIE